MRERLPKAGRRDDDEEPSGFDIAHHLLKSVKNRGDLDERLKAAGADPEAIAEILIEHEPWIDANRLLHALFYLLHPLVDRLTRDHLLREYYLLDPLLVSESAMGRLYGDVLAGRRRTPLRDWIHNVIERSTRIAAEDPELSLYHPEPGSNSRTLMLSYMCEVVNGMPHDVRRIAYMMFVDGKKYRQISEQLGLPLERCEMIVAQLTMAAARKYSEELARRKEKTVDDEAAEEAGGEHG